MQKWTSHRSAMPDLLSPPTHGYRGQSKPHTRCADAAIGAADFLSQDTFSLDLSSISNSKRLLSCGPHGVSVFTIFCILLRCA